MCIRDRIKAAKKELDKLGLEYTDFTVSSSNEIQSVVESAVGKVDALYSPTDNTIAAGASLVGQICKENKLPFVTGEEGMCKAGGLFTLSISYEDLGYAAGEMAVKILKGEAKPEDMPIKHLSNKDLVVVKNDEIVSTGYNGAPRGRKNCMDLGYCTREAMNVPSGERYELCRSVHAEMNAIISAARRDTLGATLYLAGREAKSGELLHDATSCSMCRRLIINAGIDRVVIRNTEREYSVVHVEDWVREDDSLPQQV